MAADNAVAGAETVGEARFQMALNAVLRHERGYSNRANDAGKETVIGISRKAHPEWAGWTMIDPLKVVDGQRAVKQFVDRALNLLLNEDPSLDDRRASDGDVFLARLVRDLYRAEYWLGNGCNELPLGVGELLFDMSVNHGLRLGGKLLQRGINRVYGSVTEDGFIGPESRNAIAALIRTDRKGWLLDAVRLKRVWLYNLLVAKDRKNLEFLHGWINRALEV